MTLHNLPGPKKPRPGGGAVDKGGEPPDDDDMNSVTKELLDARLETIETRMDGRILTLEAKIDGKFEELRTEMHKGFGDMTKWIVGTVLGVGAVSITILTFVMNNAVPKASASPPAPIVIYASPAAAAPPAPVPAPAAK